MQYVFLFPGQGSQFVGMGQFLGDHPIAKKIYREANDVLNTNLTALMWEGPEETLKQTQFAQPAILSVEVAIGQILAEKGIRPSLMAGHSLGEYACLVLSGAMKFQDAVLAVHRRGIHMQSAVPLGMGTMSAVLGLADDSVAEATCAEVTSSGFLVEPANYNCPGQIVISGTIQGVEKASVLLKERGAKRCIPLQVSAPFHCSMLKVAGENLGKDLETIQFEEPHVPYIANVDVEKVERANQIRSRLIAQVASPVRWTQTLIRLTKEMPQASFIEVGPGKVIAGFMKKVNESIPVQTTDTHDNLQKLLQ